MFSYCTGSQRADRWRARTPQPNRHRTPTAGRGAHAQGHQPEIDESHARRQGPRTALLDHRSGVT